jgi:hypothetical protein
MDEQLDLENGHRTYKYDVLKEDLAEFQILTIKPGNLDDGIKTSLKTYSLTRCPPYEALSYVWGKFDPSNRHTIEIENQVLEVTPNLFSALHDLRSHIRERFIWIDAICINQQDLRERSSQLQLMRNIYQSASQTVAYLGPLTSGLQLVLPLFKLIEWDEDRPPWVIRSPTDDRLLNYLLPLAPDIQGMIMAGLWEDLLERPYWSRIWIVQEIALSANPIIVFGRETIPWKLFEYGTNVLHGLFFENRIGSPKYSKSHVLRTMRTVRFLRDIVADGKAVPVESFLACLRDMEATNERDMVYGLLGLTTAEIKVDYKSTTVDTYVSLVQHCISDKKRIDIITMRRGKSTLSDLPSWAPDWSGSMTDRDEMPRPLVLEYQDTDVLYTLLSGVREIDGVKRVWDVNRFTADGDTKAAVYIPTLENSSTLEVSGIHIGRIKHNGNVLIRKSVIDITGKILC